MSVVLIPTAPRINLVDEGGKITRPWQAYFDDVFTRLGGSVAPSIDELVNDIQGLALAPVAQPFVETNGDLAPPVVTLAADQNNSGRLESLEAEVANLRQIINGIQQGIQQ